MKDQTEVVTLLRAFGSLEDYNNPNPKGQSNIG